MHLATLLGQCGPSQCLHLLHSSANTDQQRLSYRAHITAIWCGIPLNIDELGKKNTSVKNINVLLRNLSRVTEVNHK